MTDLLFFDANGEPLKLTMWDVDRIMVIRGNEGIELSNIVEVQCTNKYQRNAITVVPMAGAEEGTIEIVVPNTLLWREAPLIVYLWQQMEGTEQRTLYTGEVPIIPRARPIGYKDAEFERQQNEIDRIDRENKRIANETERIQHEQERIAAESQRKAHETERMQHELDRVTAEERRVAAERQRVSAEAAREAAETRREQLAQQMEQATEEAQNAAQSANAAAETANVAAQGASEATDAANTAAERSETAASAANSAAGRAETAATNAEAATVAANSAAQAAISAADTANGAAVRANAAAAATETIGSLVVDAPYEELSYSQGSINTTTGATNSTAKGAVRTGAIPLGEFGFSVDMPDAYTVSVFYYQGTDYIGYDEPAQISEINGGRGDTIRLVVRLTSGGNLSPSDVLGISLSVRAVTDTSLTLPFKSADAYVTGARFGTLESSIFTVSPTLTTWVQGGVDGTGQATTTSNNRIRTAFIDGTNAEYNITAAAGYKFWVWYYHTRDLNAAVSKTDTATTLRTQRGYWIVVIALKGSGSGTIRPAEAINIAIDQRVARTLHDLSGLYISMLGDSISSFKGYAPPENDTYYPTNDTSVSAVQMWWWVALNELGALPLIMDGWSGSCVTDGVRADRRPMSDIRRCQQLHAYTLGTADDYDIAVTEENISTLRLSPFVPYTPAVGDFAKRIDPDVIFVTGGGNDYSYNAPLGSWDGHTDLDTTDVGHFREAYANTLNRLREAYPNALIICFKPWFFVRPPFTTLGREQVNRNNIGLTYKDYADVIAKIAELMACPVVDGFSMGFNRYNYYPTFCSDSEEKPTHPNGLGQRVMGKNIAAQLQSICVGYIEWLKSQKK